MHKSFFDRFNGLIDEIQPLYDQLPSVQIKHDDHDGKINPTNSTAHHSLSKPNQSHQKSPSPLNGSVNTQHDVEVFVLPNNATLNNLNLPVTPSRLAHEPLVFPEPNNIVQTDPVVVQNAEIMNQTTSQQPSDQILTTTAPCSPQILPKSILFSPPPLLSFDLNDQQQDHISKSNNNNNNNNNNLNNSSPKINTFFLDTTLPIFDIPHNPREHTEQPHTQTVTMKHKGNSKSMHSSTHLQPYAHFAHPNSSTARSVYTLLTPLSHRHGIILSEGVVGDGLVFDNIPSLDSTSISSVSIPTTGSISEKLVHDVNNEAGALKNDLNKSNLRLADKPLALPVDAAVIHDIAHTQLEVLEIPNTVSYHPSLATSLYRLDDRCNDDQHVSLNIGKQMFVMKKMMSMSNEQQSSNNYRQPCPNDSFGDVENNNDLHTRLDPSINSVTPINTKYLDNSSAHSLLLSSLSSLSSPLHHSHFTTKTVRLENQLGDLMIIPQNTTHQAISVAPSDYKVYSIHDEDPLVAAMKYSDGSMIIHQPVQRQEKTMGKGTKPKHSHHFDSISHANATPRPNPTSQHNFTPSQPLQTSPRRQCTITLPFIFLCLVFVSICISTTFLFAIGVLYFPQPPNTMTNTKPSLQQLFHDTITNPTKMHSYELSQTLYPSSHHSLPLPHLPPYSLSYIMNNGQCLYTIFAWDISSSSSPHSCPASHQHLGDNSSDSDNKNVNHTASYYLQNTNDSLNHHRAAISIHYPPHTAPTNQTTTPIDDQCNRDDSNHDTSLDQPHFTSTSPLSPLSSISNTRTRIAQALYRYITSDGPVNTFFPLLITTLVTSYLVLICLPNDPLGEIVLLPAQRTPTNVHTS